MSRRPDILAAIDRSPDLRARSPLLVWLRENHVAFAARLAERKVDWKVLAQLFTENGLTNRYGKPLTAETARKAWQTVRKEIKARASAARRPAPEPTHPLMDGREPPPAAENSVDARLIVPEPMPESPKFYGPAMMRSRLPKSPTKES